MPVAQIIILSVMAGIPIGFYAHRLLNMRSMGKMTLPKKKVIVHDFTDAFDTMHYEIDESRNFAK